MGFLNKLLGKKENQPTKEGAKEMDSSTTTSKTSPTSSNQQGKRIKKYTSEGKPVFE